MSQAMYQFPTFDQFVAYMQQVCTAFQARYGQPLGYTIRVLANGLTLAGDVSCPYYTDGNGNMEVFTVGFTDANVVPVLGLIDTINMTLAFAMMADQRSVANPNPPYNALKAV